LRFVSFLPIISAREKFGAGLFKTIAFSSLLVAFRSPCSTASTICEQSAVAFSTAIVAVPVSQISLILLLYVFEGTLLSNVHHCNQLSTGSGEFRPGIVHRLDRNTTGVMVAAKSDTAHWRLSHQFEHRQTKKTYIAIAHGVPELTADVINKPLGVHPKIREKYAIRPEMGKEAVTFYEVMEAFKGFSLLKVKPHTGRTHQIRVHLSHIKHPIVGDDMYGGKMVYLWQLKNEEARAEEPIMGRVALHAFELQITHPITGKPMTFEAALPPDMQACLDMLREFRAIPKKKRPA
jgi:23S rRNA pseudouridine1911/1915/1917 synthase